MDLGLLLANSEEQVILHSKRSSLYKFLYTKIVEEKNKHKILRIPTSKTILL